MITQTIKNIVIHELDVNQLRRDNVVLEGPKRLGYFSCYDNNNDSVYCPNKSALRYLTLPEPVNINCLQGYDPAKKYGHIVSRDLLLLRWVLENEETVQKFHSDFICNNGIMKDMMITKYNDDDWNLSAVKIRGKIILNKNESFKKKEKIASQSDKNNKSAYTSFNLQRLISKNNKCPKCADEEKNDSFYGVFHTKIGSHQILHAGWLHSVESKQELVKPFDEMKFVAIKKFNAPRESQSAFQSSTWWSLAKLAGVDTVVRAKCERDFTVKKIDKLEVQDLILKHRQIIFFASLNMALDFIKTIVTEENECYNFSFNAKDKKLIGYMKIEPDENLIPSWYTDVQLASKS